MVSPFAVNGQSSEIPRKRPIHFSGWFPVGSYQVHQRRKTGSAWSKKRHRSAIQIIVSVKERNKKILLRTGPAVKNISGYGTSIRLKWGGKTATIDFKKAAQMCVEPIRKE